jgi:hypothetical protein
MPTEFVSDGVDFDDLFDPDIMGNGPPATWLENNGVPLRYAALSYGTKRADVGYDDAGVDVSNLWAAKGTAVYNIPGLHGKSLSAGDNAFTNQPDVFAQVYFTLQSNGTWNVAGGNSRGAVAQADPTSGTWLPAGASVSDFQVQFVVTSGGTNSSGGAAQQQVTNGAPAYAALTTARGVTLTMPQMSASSSIERDGWANVTINLRRISSGSVSSSTVSMVVSTVGWA